MRRWLSLLSTAALGLALVSVGPPMSSAATPVDEWESVAAPAGLAHVGTNSLWTGEEGVAYVLGRASDTAPYDTVVYKYDGAWHLELTIPDYQPGRIVGSGPNDIYVSAYTCWTGTAWSCPSDNNANNALGTVLYHFNGTAWSSVTLPAEMTDSTVLQIWGMVATTSEIQIAAGYKIFRDTGSGWTEVYYDNVYPRIVGKIMTAVGPNEFYAASCHGHVKWDGSTWGTATVSPVDFCDNVDIWGIRDGGDLSLRVTGNPSFHSALRIWLYDEATDSFNLPNYEFTDSGSGGGSGYGLWGTAADDVWATGGVYNDGAIYHNNGSGWVEVTDLGALGSAATLLAEDRVFDVWGTGAGDVWFVTEYGRLFHRTLANEAPVADADGPYAVNTSQTFSADGTGSYDPDGDALTYDWLWRGSHYSGATPTLTAPSSGGDYDLTLTVSDGTASASDTTTVHVNTPPVVRTSGPYYVNVGETFNVDGYNAYDVDNDNLDYWWTFNGTTTYGVEVTFTAPSVAGSYPAELKIYDGYVYVTGTTTVYVNTPPVADAGGPYSVNVGETFTVNGSGSSDADGDGLAYTWGFRGVTKTGVAPTFTAPDTAGIYTLSLAVNDGHATDTTTAQVYVHDRADGFATGGGWIDSPEGAYVDDPTADGKATFNFSAKYVKKFDGPVGSVELVLKSAGLEFFSDSFDWLVVTNGNEADLKGTGTINGTGTYGFRLWAVDGGKTGDDTFHLVIKTPGGTVVYDNGVQIPDKGMIKVHD